MSSSVGSGELTADESVGSAPEAVTVLLDRARGDVVRVRGLATRTGGALAGSEFDRVVFLAILLLWFVAARTDRSTTSRCSDTQV
jgi:hypothetical protein